MRSIQRRLKAMVELVPEPIGRHLALVPFSWRLGQTYPYFRKKVNAFLNGSPEEQRTYVLDHLRRMATYAFDNIISYRTIYQEHGFNPDDIANFDDLRQIPIVTKADLREWSLDARSSPELGRLKMNTGGTTGSPLSFYVDAKAFAREWAHMHHIWGQIGYQPTDLKMTFRGKNIGDRPYTYNAIHNEYIINSYQGYSLAKNDLLTLIQRREIKYLHGYPSAIYEFVRYCMSECPEIVHALRKTLRGVLLGSEYPAPVYRNTIERVLETSTSSWYGHSEMAVLAYETDKPFVYHPMHTYGYTEAISDGNGEYRLIGTSYYNTASPFVRYDTGDRVKEIEICNGLLAHFEVASGRVGDFIIDRDGHRISLTSLIFGRHHQLFDEAEFVQVRQEVPGHATIVVTQPPTGVERVDWASLFDARNVNLTLNFEVRNKPVRTEQGKVRLLI